MRISWLSREHAEKCELSTAARKRGDAEKQYSLLSTKLLYRYVHKTVGFYRADMKEKR